MKKIKTKHLLLAVLVLILSCSKYDDSALWEKIKDHESRIAKLEILCEQLNTNIVSLKELVEAMKNNVSIKSVTPVMNGNVEIGQVITFSDDTFITIYHGTNGKNGSDGVTPKIGVAIGEDGVYYWTIDGAWLLDENGNRLQVSGNDGEDGVDGKDGADGNNGIDGKDGVAGKDGANGKDGKDGVTPKFKIEDEYWYISYDGGQSWEKLGKATGANGINGTNGDNVFKSVDIKDGYVVFTLDDGKDTEIKLPFVSETTICIYLLDGAGTIGKSITMEQQRSTISLKLIGEYNDEDIRFIMTFMNSLEELDLSDATKVDNYKLILNPWETISANRTIRNLIIGGQKASEQLNFSVDFSYCISLESITFTHNQTYISASSIPFSSVGGWPVKSSAKGTYFFKTLIVNEGVTDISIPIASGKESGTFGIAQTIFLPSTIEKVEYHMFGLYSRTNMVICKALTPPDVFEYATWGGGIYEFKKQSSFYDSYNVIKDKTLYVPANSIDLYKEHSAWSKFGSILPIE